MPSHHSDLLCQNLVKAFGDIQAVDDVSFEVPKGSFFSILGPSGCGKTTLLRMIAGFQSPTSGDLLIKGKSMINVPPNKRPVSMVFQHLALFPTMNIGANVGFGLRQRGVSKSDIKKRVDEVLARVGLPNVAQRQVNELSGGQKQRVAIARCMVLEPDVLLLDEPLGALDLKLREHMKIELKSLQAEFNTTFVYITHDQSEALVMSDNVAVMNHGKFEQIGTPHDIYHEPKTSFVAGFVGEANTFKAKITEKYNNVLSLTTERGGHMKALTNDPDLAVGTSTQVYLRPEAIELTRDHSEAFEGNITSGIVENVLFNGANSVITIRDNTDTLLNVTAPQTGDMTTLRQGDSVHARWQPDRAHCYRETH